MPYAFRRLSALLSLLATSVIIHASEPVDPLRLTSEVVPVAQSVELTLDPAKDDFTGHTIIDLLANAPFTSFRLHAEGPAFTTATLTSADGVVTTARRRTRLRVRPAAQHPTRTQQPHTQEDSPPLPCSNTKCLQPNLRQLYAQ